MENRRDTGNLDRLGHHAELQRNCRLDFKPKSQRHTSRRCQRPCEQRKQLLRLVVEAGRLWLGPPNHSRPCVPVRSLLSDDDPTRAGNRRAADSTWVGRSGGPSRDGRQRCQPGGSDGLSAGRVGRLRAAGWSIGGTESKTPPTGFVSRSLETQSLLSTSLRLREVTT